jgi:hypothetical protein
VDDEDVGSALVAAVPELSGVLEDHRNDYGRVLAVELFGDALRFSAYEWGEGRPSVAARVLAFMENALAGNADRAREYVVKGVLEPIALAASSPALEEFLSIWPESLRRELERLRSARRPVMDGVWIEFPEAERIEVIWAVDDALEAVASDGATAYVVGEAVTAVGVADGHLVWRYDGHDGTPLHSSGGVTISTSAGGSLQVFAPFEYVVQLDRETGVEVSWHDGPDAAQPPVGSPLPDFPLRDCTVDSSDLRSVRIETNEGAHLATLIVAQPSFDLLSSMQINDVLVVSLASGHVLALRRR